MSTPFLGDSWFVCTHVLWVPATPLTNGFFVFVFSFDGNLGSFQDSNIPKNTKHTKYVYIWRKTNRKQKHSVADRQELTEHVCRISGPHLQKIGVDIGRLTTLGGYFEVCLDRPVRLRMLRLFSMPFSVTKMGVFGARMYVFVLHGASAATTVVWCEGSSLLDYR